MSTRSATAHLASGRYTVYGEIASGGMATIQYGRLSGGGGFSRSVAIKRLHPQFAKDQNFVSMFLDEARLSARIAHANVVQTLDVLSEPGELSVVMEYVHGESLARLLQRLNALGERVPVRVAVTLMVGVLHGLHAAHETRGEHGEPLHIVHRDVSPENILVGSDGVPRLLDFGIARAQGRSRVTPAGELKGKLAYMSCEQYRGQDVDRRVDVYGASVVLWESLVGRELFKGETDAAIVGAVMNETIVPPSRYAPEVPKALDQIVLRGLSRERDQRFESAREMAQALEREIGVVTQSEVTDWLERVAGTMLAERAEMLRSMRMRADAGTSDASAPITRRLEPGSTPVTPQAEPAAQIPRTQTRIRETTHAGSSPKRWLAGLLLVGLALASALAAWWTQSNGGLGAQFQASPGLQQTPAGARQAGPEEPPRSAEDEPQVGLEAPSQPSPGSERAPALTRPGTDARDARGTAQPKASEAPSSAVAKSPATKSSPSQSDKAASAATKRRGDKAAATPNRGGRAKSNTPALDCSQPFWVDERGIRHARRECLND